jgi:hypothetical protein
MTNVKTRRRVDAPRSALIRQFYEKTDYGIRRILITRQSVAGASLSFCDRFIPRPTGHRSTANLRRALHMRPDF